MNKISLMLMLWAFSILGFMLIFAKTIFPIVDKIMYLIFDTIYFKYYLAFIPLIIIGIILKIEKDKKEVKRLEE